MFISLAKESLLKGGLLYGVNEKSELLATHDDDDDDDDDDLCSEESHS